MINISRIHTSCVFRRFLKISKSDCWLRHVCLSVRPLGKTRLPLDGFHEIWYEYFVKIWQEISSFIKIWQEYTCVLDVGLSMLRCICVEKKNQLDATEWFIAFIICSIYFGHLYANHQELESLCVLLPPMVCDALVAGCWRSGARQPAMRSGWGMLLEQNS